MKLKNLVVYLLLLFCSPFLHAQFILSKQYTLNEGLISNDINKVFIASNSDLYLGSSAGLIKKQMALFLQEPISKALKFNNIFDITEDKDGGIWSASYGQGVLYLKAKEYKLFDHKTDLISDRARALFYYNDQIYVGTQNGVSIINTVDHSVISPYFEQDKDYYFEVSGFFQTKGQVYATTINDGVYLVKPDTLEKVLDTKKILSCYSDNKAIYLGTQDGLLELSTENLQLIHKYDLDNVRDYVEINCQTYFLASGAYQSQGGIFSLWDNEIHSLSSQFSLPTTGLSSMTFDPKHHFLYISSKNAGFFQVDLDAPVRHEPLKGIVYTIATANKKAFVFAKDGLSVFKNNQVLDKIDLKQFKDFQVKNSHKYSQRATIKEHFFPIDYSTTYQEVVFYSSKVYNNSLWVSSNIGLFEIDMAKSAIIDYYPVHTYVFDFYKDSLVMAVPYGGIRVFTDIKNFEYIYFHHWDNVRLNKEISNIPTEVVSMAVGDNGVYFGTALKGVFHYKDGYFTSWYEKGILQEKKIKKISITPSEQLIVATDFNDIYSINTTWDIEVLEQQIPKPIVPFTKVIGHDIRFLEQKKDLLFVGTNLGVNAFVGDRHFFLDQEQGIFDSNLTCGVQGDSILYLGSYEGFFEVNTLFFGSMNSFDFDISLSEVLINDKAIELHDSDTQQKTASLVLNSTQNNVVINFVTRRFEYPDKISFQYRLMPSEPWKPIKQSNTISLFYLNTGQYHVELQVSDLASGQVKVVELLELTISPPFYKTYWFITCCFILLLCVLAVIYSIRISILTKKQEKQLYYISQKNKVQEKQLLLEKQLADVKLQALQSQMNSHFLFNVLSSIQFFIISNDVDKALYYIERFASLIRTTLTYSDYKQVNLKQEIEYIEKYIEIENIRVNNKVNFKVEMDADAEPTNIFITPMLLQPFVENSIIHGFNNTVTNPTITLKVVQLAHSWRLILTDNGVGFKQGNSTKRVSKGISIIQRRLELTNNKDSLRIVSSDKGTTIEIDL
ncbi:sensor histidine kinase [Myroides sp. LJL116]